MEVSFTSFVGIDVSKASLDVHHLPEEQRHRVSNDKPGIQELLDALARAWELHDRGSRPQERITDVSSPIWSMPGTRLL